MTLEEKFYMRDDEGDEFSEPGSYGDTIEEEDYEEEEEEEEAEVPSGGGSSQNLFHRDQSHQGQVEGQETEDRPSLLRLGRNQADGRRVRNRGEAAGLRGRRQRSRQRNQLKNRPRSLRGEKLQRGVRERNLEGGHLSGPQKTRKPRKRSLGEEGRTPQVRMPFTVKLWELGRSASCGFFIEEMAGR